MKNTGEIHIVLSVRDTKSYDQLMYSIESIAKDTMIAAEFSVRTFNDGSGLGLIKRSEIKKLIRIAEHNLADLRLKEDRFHRSWNDYQESYRTLRRKSKVKLTGNMVSKEEE